jgi:benzoyl-CoA reductase/2-hydroxyglutaryl-CoA dehydratase subunit BcrC/BadD/HgdB
MNNMKGDREDALRIGVMDWEARMPDIPEEYRERCTSLRSLVPGGVRYLFSPYEYSCRGDTLLRRLRFDNSFAALRLWAFIFSEKDRLFLAKEKGWKIFAAMKDLGSVPVLSYAVPESLTFYADELWWAPCFSEEPHLLEEAGKLGAGEELCFVRAALGAMVTLDYFPPPDLCIASVGPVCDDFSAVMQLIEGLGFPVHWWEMAARFDPSPALATERFLRTPYGGSPYQSSALGFVTSQLRGVVKKLEEVSGREITEQMLRQNLARFNGIRGRVSELRNLVYGAKRPPLPGLEMLLTEFIAIHACSEPEESVAVLDDLLDTVRRRLDAGVSPLSEDPIRVFWATPPTDAALVTLLEDLGGCIAGTEYLISHSFNPLSTDRHPLEAVAESALDDPMIGSNRFRAGRIVEGAKRFGAEGVIVSGISGASHCPFDESAITRAVAKELDIPVLSFDVPYSPGRLSEQVVSRMQSFMDLLRSRRGVSCAVGTTPVGESAVSETGPFEYFRNSMSREVDYIRAAKRKGKGVVGIYCEFTPRELILAADAVPVCLCGASARTIPTAESVLPANLCPLIKSSFGYILTNRCPFYVVTDLIVAETTCDGKKKMYELIEQKKPVHVLELTQKVKEQEAFAHWLDEVKKLRARLEEVFKVEITDEKLRDAIKLMNLERKLLREALLLGAEDPPVVSGRELSDLRYRVAGCHGHITMIEDFIAGVGGRKERGEFIAKKGAPRVLLTGCPTAQGTTKLIDIIEESGAVVVVQEACSGWKPLETLTSEEGDPLEAIARKHFDLPCSCMTPNTGRTALIEDLAGRFRADAVIDLVWQACHTYNVESYLVEGFVRDRLGLPYMKIETDYSDSDRERLRVRVQTLMEML